MTQPPETTTLATRDPFAIMDALDEKTILATFQGQIPDHWVYRIVIDGKTTEGLSAPGVEEAARYMAAREHEVLRELHVHLDSETAREGRFVAAAGRFALLEDGSEVQLDTAVRGKRQPKYRRLKTGEVKFNDHWYETGVTKAARNAKAALIPDRVKQAIIRLAIKKGRVQTATDADAPPNSDAPRSLGACPIHHKAIIEGQYRPYCPTKVPGDDGKERWCKGLAGDASNQPAPGAASDELPSPDSFKNIGQLLTAAKKHFGMSRQDVFDLVGISSPMEITSITGTWDAILADKRPQPLEGEVEDPTEYA